MANVEFNYEVKEITIQCNRNDNMKKYFNNLVQKLEKNQIYWPFYIMEVQ